MTERSLLICVSVSHGSTARVARSIAKVVDADVREPEEVDPATIPGRDLVGFGSGIFAGTHHRRLRRYVEALPPGRGTKAFVFTTAGLGRAQSWPGQRTLEAVLQDKGYDVVGVVRLPGLRHLAAAEAGRRDQQGTPGPQRPGPGAAVRTPPRRADRVALRTVESARLAGYAVDQTRRLDGVRSTRRADSTGFVDQTRRLEVRARRGPCGSGCRRPGTPCRGTAPTG